MMHHHLKFLTFFILCFYLLYCYLDRGITNLLREKMMERCVELMILGHEWKKITLPYLKENRLEKIRGNKDRVL